MSSRGLCLVIEDDQDIRELITLILADDLKQWLGALPTLKTEQA